MVFAARKLQRVGLGDPTVLLIIDRKELDEQINETLAATEFEGVQQPRNRKQPRRRCSPAGGGGVIVTTAQKFDASMAGLLEGRQRSSPSSTRRTAASSASSACSCATRFRHAFLFGFTGTPIEQGGKHSTRRWFSVELDDGSYEPYLDRYGFDQAIADKATVPVVYEPRLADWRMSRTDIDARFDELTAGCLRTSATSLREQATREKVVAKAPERVKAHRGRHRRATPTTASAPFAGARRRRRPRSLRTARRGVSKHLKPEEYAVVMSRSKKDSAPARGQHRPARVVSGRPMGARARSAGRRHPRVAEPEIDDDLDDEEEFIAVTDRAAIKDFIKRLKSENDPLRAAHRQLDAADRL